MEDLQTQGFEGKPEKPKRKHRSTGKPRGGAREDSGTKMDSISLMTTKERRRFFLKLLGEGDTFEEICRSLFEKAKKDPKVAAYILDQGIGKPMQAVELTGEDGGPIDFRNRSDDELRNLAESAGGIGQA